MTDDVIIAGSSFAGLAVASRLRGKILLIDPNAAGEHQTSGLSHVREYFYFFTAFLSSATTGLLPIFKNSVLWMFRTEGERARFPRALYG